MNLNEFKMMLRDADLIPVRRGSNAARSKKPQVSVEEEGFARMAFARSQKTSEGSDISDLGEMTYPEFVEGILWYAMLKKSAENDYMDYKHMSLQKRVESFHTIVQTLVGLQIAHEKKESKKH